VLLLVGGFVMFLVALTGEALAGMLTRSQSIALYIVGVVMLIALVTYDLRWRRGKPVVQFHMFESLMFSCSQFCGMLTAFARGLVLFAAIFFCSRAHMHPRLLTLAFTPFLLEEAFS